MKYFSVKAKCGHVGRGHYYEGEFFVQAENAPDAAKIVRFMPRVKHHHKDAILSVFEISYEVYQEGQATYYSNPYFRCKNKKEQNQILHKLTDRVFLEVDYNQPRKNNEDRLAKLKLIRRQMRKENKYALRLEA